MNSEVDSELATLLALARAEGCFETWTQTDDLLVVRSGCVTYKLGLTNAAEFLRGLRSVRLLRAELA